VATRRLVRTCGLIGLFGCLVAVVTDVMGWILVDGYDPISQTISNLAVGRWSWLLDLGLYLLATACFATAVGLAARRLGGASWTFAAAAVALLGIDVIVVAAFDEYAGTTNPGADVHSAAVYALGALFALACLLAVPGLKRLHGSLGRFSLVVGLAWIVLAPLFFLVPNAWDGAYERFLALILLGWLATMASRVLLRAHDGALA
jgi:hypothetical protein